MQMNPGMLAVVAGAALCSTAQGQSVEALEAPPGDMASVLEAEQDLPGEQKGPRDRVTPPAPVKPAEATNKDTPFWQYERLTGDWAGHRSWLESKGLTINASLTMNWSSVVDGGANERAGFRHLWDVNAKLDLDAFAGLKGGSLFVDFQSSDDRGRMADSGSFTGTNSIEYSRNIDEIGEAWYEQKLFDDVVRAKIGKIDVNNEFFVIGSQGDFLNGSAGTGVNLLAFPTVPAQATGVVLFVYPTERSYIGGGFFDGATQDGIRTGGRGPADFFSDARSQSWYWIAEGGLGWECSMGDGRVAAGFWHHTGDFARFDSNIEEGTEGVYALAEQQFWRRGTGDADKAKGVWGFAQWSWADDDIAPVRNDIGAGVTYKGVCESRSNDSIGLYWNWCNTTDEALAGTETDEHAFELFYKAMITPSIYVQPDVQFIANPSGRRTIDDAWVLGVQVGVAF